MKKSLFLSAAAALAVVAPGVASAEVRGSINLGFEHDDFSYTSDAYQSYNLGGTLITDVSGMDVQLDGRATLQDWSYSYYSHGYAAAHLSADMGGWDLGGYGGFLNYYGDGAIMLGGEARTAMGNFSLDGSISYADFADRNYDSIGYRAGGAYFFSPNLALTGGASYTEIDTSGTDYDITELSIGGAYQLANNVALSLDYTSTDGDRSTGSEYDGDTIRLGATFNFGGGSLQDNTNDGAWRAAEHVSNTWLRW